MRYAKAVLIDRTDEIAYRNYISDTLYLYAQRKGLNKRYSELIQHRKTDHRSGDEIAADVIKRVGITVLSSEEVSENG